jgi:hypothetical protein
MGLCGGNDFRHAHLKDGGLSAGKTEGNGSKRVGKLWITKPSQSPVKWGVIAESNASDVTQGWHVHVASAFPLSPHYRAVLAGGPYALSHEVSRPWGMAISNFIKLYKKFQISRSIL